MKRLQKHRLLNMPKKCNKFVFARVCPVAIFGMTPDSLVAIFGMMPDSLVAIFDYLGKLHLKIYFSEAMKESHFG